MHFLQPACKQLHRKGKVCASSHRRTTKAKQSLTVDVLDVPVHMQLHTKPLLFFLGGVSDVKGFDMVFTRYFSLPSATDRLQ